MKTSYKIFCLLYVVFISFNLKIILYDIKAVKLTKKQNK